MHDMTLFGLSIKHLPVASNQLKMVTQQWLVWSQSNDF
jgi:hypothetical protein